MLPIPGSGNSAPSTLGSAGVQGQGWGASMARPSRGAGALGGAVTASTLEPRWRATCGGRLGDPHEPRGRRPGRRWLPVVGPGVGPGVGFIGDARRDLGGAWSRGRVRASGVGWMSRSGLELGAAGGRLEGAGLVGVGLPSVDREGAAWLSSARAAGRRVGFLGSPTPTEQPGHPPSRNRAPGAQPQASPGYLPGKPDNALTEPAAGPGGRGRQADDGLEFLPG